MASEDFTLFIRSYPRLLDEALHWFVNDADNPFQLQYRFSVATFRIYEKAARQGSQLTRFYEECKGMGVDGGQGEDEKHRVYKLMEDEEETKIEMKEADLQRKKGLKLKLSVDGGLVFLLGGVVAGVAMAAIITNLIRKRKQKKSIDNGTTAQPDRGMEDAQEPRSLLAPSEEHHNCTPIRVRLADQDGSEAGQPTPTPTPTPTSMASNSRARALPTIYNYMEISDYNDIIMFSEFPFRNPASLLMPGNPASFPAVLPPNLAGLEACNTPIDGLDENQIRNGSLNEPVEVLPVPQETLRDGGNMLVEKGKNFHDVTYFVAYALNPNQLMILILAGLLMILTVAYLIYDIAMAYINICTPCNLLDRY